MELESGKLKFIEEWGKLGTQWGINRTMAQIHALLLVCPEPICAEDIMEELGISRGNANMNIRALIDWGLLYKEHIKGERKEYFRAEKDMFMVFKQIILQRRKKELDPLLKMVNELSHVRSDCNHSEEFCNVLQDIRTFSVKADTALTTLLETESNWISNIFFKMIR